MRKGKSTSTSKDKQTKSERSLPKTPKQTLKSKSPKSAKKKSSPNTSKSQQSLAPKQQVEEAKKSEKDNSLPPKMIKSILKKPKAEESKHNPYEDSYKNDSILVQEYKPPVKNPIGIIEAYQNQKNAQAATVDSAFMEYLTLQESLAARGQLEEALQTLQEGLGERMSLYPAREKGIWLISKLIAEIGIRMGVRYLNSGKNDKAHQFLKMARKYTEPLPNSDWNEDPEWMNTRKNVFKNQALYYQRLEEWLKAFDCFRVALKLEQDLHENQANTSLTCAVILSKLNRYAESIDYAQTCMQQVETSLSIDRHKPLAEYKYFGSDQDKLADFDKQMTTYAISLHLLGKNLSNLKYVKEAKVFLSKAHYVALNMLSVQKPDLQLAIQNDLNNINKVYKGSLNANNKKSTVDDIESSLMTIKTNIANTSYSQQADLQEQKALTGTLSDGPPKKMLIKSEQKRKKGMKKGNEKDDDDKYVYDFVKRFADEKREKDSEVLEEFHRKQQQTFSEKQKEFMDKQVSKRMKTAKSMKSVETKSENLIQSIIAKPNEKQPELVVQQISTKQQVQERKGRQLSQTGKKIMVNKVNENGDGGADKSSTERVKKASINPAADGAKLDRKGIKYSGERGVKSFFNKRRENIARVNGRLGYMSSGSDEGDNDNSYEEIRGGTSNKRGRESNMGSRRDSEVSLPPIKGYKLDQIGIKAQVSRFAGGGYQSDSNKQLFKNDPGTVKLVESIGDKYKKKPSSIRDESMDMTENNKGGIKPIPTYQAKKKDWRDEVNKSSTDDELPDPLLVAKMQLKGQDGPTVLFDDAALKMSIVDGDTTKYEEKKVPEIVQATTEDENRMRKIILNKPPKSIPKKKASDSQQQEESQSASDLKSKLEGKIGKKLGMSRKGSPRDLSISENPDRSVADSSKPSINLPRSKPRQGQQQRPTQHKKQQPQYVSPDQRKREEHASSIWGGLDSDERKQKSLIDDERIRQLSQPKPKHYVLVKDDEEDELNQEEEKIKSILNKLEKNKSINFSDYVSREVPAIKNNTITTGKLGDKLFDTKLNNKTGLFSRIKEQVQNSDKNVGETKYIQDKKPKKKRAKNTDERQQEDSSKNQIEYEDDKSLPTFMKKLRQGLGNGSPSKFKDSATLSSLKKLQSRVSGLNYKQNKGMGFSIRDLRELENEATLIIQKYTRKYFTRKWYKDFIKRQRLGVPFSGMEFTENPFLRQFNRINRQLQQIASVDPQLMEVVEAQEDQRNIIRRQYKHGRVLEEKERRKLYSETNYNTGSGDIQMGNISKQISPKRKTKGQTQEQLLNNLQQDFLAKGLDAYPQFKKLGSGIEHDEDGNEIIHFKPKMKDQEAEVRDIETQGKPVAKWIEDRDKQDYFIEIGENEQYIIKSNKLKAKKEDKPERSYYDNSQKQNFVSSLAAYSVMNKGPLHKKQLFSNNNSHEHQMEGDEEGLGLDDSDIRQLLKKKRQIDEDEDYYPIEKYQDFSREAIVFYKAIGNHYVKWTVVVGNAFKKDKKFYIPIKILGEPMKSRNALVSYLMNVEMIKISKDIEKNFNFETIWPFILYLVNNWVRHQVRLMGIIESKPELKTKFAQSEAQMYEVKAFDENIKEIQEDYNDMLNFSSEIEFDDRFDLDKYKADYKPDAQINRNQPHNQRLKPLEQLEVNKKKLFETYKQKISTIEGKQQAMDSHVVTGLSTAQQKYDEFRKNLGNDEYEQDGDAVPKKRVRILLDDVYGPQETRKVNPFDHFLKKHYIPLPPPESGMHRLIQNQQALNYASKLKNQGLISDNIILMNEERRKRKNLPPLSVVDYNCIDRAALKIKFILDCLYFRRQMNGWVLVPRDVKESLLAKEWVLLRTKHIRTVVKMDDLSLDLIKAFGYHIEYENQFNENAQQVVQSLKKIEQFKNKKHINLIKSESNQDMDEYEESQEDEEDESSPNNKLQVIPFQLNANTNTNEDVLDKLMDYQKKKLEVEDYLQDEEIMEQSTIMIEENPYIMTLLFRKIKSNYLNTRALIDERIRKLEGHQNESEDEGVDYQEQEEGVHVRNMNPKRMMIARICAFVSWHPEVQSYDGANYADINQNEKIDIDQEQFTKEHTYFKSYAEIKVCSKISSTNWDDSFNITWETITKFFSQFNIKWSGIQFMKRRNFSDKERFLFYQFFPQCLYIYDCKVHVDLQRLDIHNFKFDYIYRNLEEIKENKRIHRLPYYYDDMLGPDFDPAIYDEPVFPFYEDPRLVTNYIMIEEDDIYFDYNLTEEDKQAQQVTTKVESQGAGGKRKREFPVDEATQEYMDDPNHMFNLTLSNFPKSDGLYLGQIYLGDPDVYKSKYNLRIDYYVLGYKQILEIKAFNCIHDDIFDCKVTNKKMIKDVIRICNQESMSMITNQLSSLLSVKRKINGKHLRLNFNIRKNKLQNLQQNYISMLVCNESILRQQNNNFKQFQGVVFCENLGGRMLITVTQFEMEVELMGYNVKDMQMMHGNKHLSQDQLREMKKRELPRQMMGAQSKKKFHKVKFWKVNLFNIFSSKHYDAVISYDDLIEYYESELFQVYEKNPNIVQPNLVQLLNEYIRNIYIFRTKVGHILYWRLPQFKNPLNEKGQAIPVPPEHLFQMKLLNIYLTLQKKIDEQNKLEDQNVLPFSLDQLKAKRQQRQPPSLSLRNKFIIEQEMPIFDHHDTKILKLTASEQRLIVQVPKVFTSLQITSFTLITVTLYPTMEFWIWNIYFLKTQRTFSVTFYASDLFNMNQEILNLSDLKRYKDPEVGLWTELIRRSQLEVNPSGDVILVVEQFKEPLKEILHQDHVYNENAQDIFFMEVTIKYHNNYVTDVRHPFPPLDLQSDEVKDFTICLRAFSLTRNIWIKDYQPLTEILKLLKQEAYLTDHVKLLYYSMLRDAALLLSHKIVFSEEAKTAEVKKRKMTYDIRSIIGNKAKFEQMQEEFRDPLFPDKKLSLSQRKAKQTSVWNGKGLVESQRAEGLLGEADTDERGIVQVTNGLRSEWRNMIELNKIIYQDVVAKNPCQICTIIYNDVKDIFIYRLYRASDCSFIEKRLSGFDIKLKCAPHYAQMIKNKMFKQLGERISKCYMTDVIVASLLNYYHINQ